MTRKNLNRRRAKQKAKKFERIMLRSQELLLMMVENRDRPMGEYIKWIEGQRDTLEEIRSAIGESC